MKREISLERLALLAGNLATCVASGMAMPESLRLSAGDVSGPLRSGVDAAVRRLEAGEELSEALETLRPHLPRFFIPVIRCGERSGRLVEVLGYLERHCRLLAGPRRAARNIWLYPLVVILFGALVRIVAFFVFAPFGTALYYLVRTVLSYSTMAVGCVLLFFTRRGRLVLDWAKLALPLINAIERDLALNRFFHTFHLMYSTGTLRVEAMMQLAIATVGNRFLRDDLTRAVSCVESGSSIAEAFAAPTRIEPEEKQLIASGDEAGKLEEAFDQLARRTADSAMTRLAAVQQIALRLVALMVTMSVVGTIYGLVSAFR